MAIKTQLPTHTGTENGATIKAAMQSDIQLLEDTFNNIFGAGSFDLFCKSIQTDKITLPDGTITSAATLGGTAQTLAAAIALGKEADLAGVDFALKDGTRDLLRVDAKRGLAGMVTRMSQPMACLMLKSLHEITNGGRFAGIPTYTCANTQTYIDSLTGLMKVAAINEPVFERRSDGTIGQRFSPAVQNFVLNSEDGAHFNVTGGTVTVNDVTGIDGALSMHTFTEDAATGFHQLSKPIVSVAGQNTFQFKIKPISGVTQIEAYIANGTDGNAASVSFDFANATTTAAIGSGTIKDLGKGIYLCTITGTTTITGSSFYIRNTTGGLTHAGNTATKFAFQHPQVEAGYIPHYYVPTTGSSLVKAGTSATSIQAIGNLPTIAFTKDFCIDFDYESPVDSAFSTQLLNVLGAGNLLIRHRSWIDYMQVYLGANNYVWVGKAYAPANQVNHCALVNRNGTFEVWLNYQRVAIKPSTEMIGTPTDIQMGGACDCNISNVNVRDFAPTEMEMGA